MEAVGKRKKYFSDIIENEKSFYGIIVKILVLIVSAI